MSLTHDTLLSTDERHRGLLYFGGARMAMLDIEAGFWGLRRQLEALVGRKLADAVLQQAGANGGASFARTFVGQTDDAQALRDCVAAYQAAGFGQFEIVELEWPLNDVKDRPTGHVLIRAHEAFEAWAAQRNGQASESPVCAYTAGALVGFVNVLAGRQDVVCIERACQAQGAEACEFELLPAEAAEGVPVVALARDPALGRQLNLLELLFDRMPMGIAVLDRAYHIQRYNPTWRDFSRQYAPPAAAPLAPGVFYFDHLPGSEPIVVPLFERVLAGETIRQEALRFESGGIVSYWDVVLAPLVEDDEVRGILNVTIDATERVQAHQELEKTMQTLRRREERLTLVMEGINDGVWDWDLEADEVYFSPRWKSMLGYTEDEIPNEFTSWERLIHPGDRERALAALQVHLAGHTEVYRLEHRLRHKDGVYRWILARGKALRHTDGTPYRLLGSHTDVTERKLTEEALRTSEGHLRSLLENARNFAVYRLAVDPSEPHGARVVLVSPSMRELMGIADPYDFRLWFEMIHPDDLPRVVAANQKAIDRGVPYSETVRCYHRERREWIWVQTTSTPILDERGRVTHFDGLVLDVTDQKRAQEALHDAYATLEQRVEERTRELATLLQVSHDVNSTLELDPLLDLILDQLKTVVDYIGASILILEGKELVSRAYRGPVPEEQVRRMRFSLEGALVNRYVVRRREPIVIRDVQGDTPPARLFQQSAEGEYGLTFGYIRSWMGVPLIVKNEVLGMLTLDHSEPGFLTEQHAELVLAFANQVAVAIENARLYEHAEEAAVAAERNRLARDLHDAVTQTLFSSTLIAEVLPRIWERDPEQGQYRLQELRELTRGALAEMRTLLLELRPAALEEAELGDLLRQLAESITGRARVPVALEVEGKCKLAAEAKVALYRIAQEALNNVAKHAGATRATVSLRCISSSGRETEDQVELCVCDDGMGFDPSSIRPNSLGLGIMRERAEAIGAALQIESSPGEGTGITVTWCNAR